jgi:hypothetical protein
VLLRQLRLFGCETTARFVLIIAHWGTRRFWSHAFARRIFLPLLSLLIISFSLIVVRFSSYHKGLLVVRGKQGGRICATGTNSRPDL